MFVCECSANNSPWIKMTKVTIVVVLALIDSLGFAQEAFGSV